MNTQVLGLSITAFLAGAVIMILEIVGFRIFAPYFGFSVYMSGSLIGIVLVALSIGYYYGGHLADRKPDRSMLFSLILWADLYVIATSFFYNQVLASLSRLGVVWGSIIGSIVVLGPSMVLLSTVSPYVIKLLTKNKSVVGSVAGTISSVSTIGSIVGTFAASFLLIPWLGSRVTLYLCSVILLVVAVSGLVRKDKKYLIALLLLFAFNILPESTEKNVIHEEESVYNLIKVVESPDGLFLKLNSYQWVQSVHKEEDLVRYYYDYMNVGPILADAEDVLILGLGAGTSAHQFLKYFDVEIDGVEIDPNVIDVGKTYFELEESDRLQIFVEDARPFLERSDKMYDLIELDVFQGGIYAPFYVLTQEFFELVHDHLSPNGVLVMNVFAPKGEKGKLLVNAVGGTIGSVFPSLYTIELTSNHVLFATKQMTELEGMREKMHAYEGNEELELFIRSLVPRLEVFEVGDSLILTDDKAPAAALTYEMVKEI